MLKTLPPVPGSSGDDQHCQRCGSLLTCHECGSPQTLAAITTAGIEEALKAAAGGNVYFVAEDGAITIDGVFREHELIQAIRALAERCLSS